MHQSAKKFKHEAAMADLTKRLRRKSNFCAKWSAVLQHLNLFATLRAESSLMMILVKPI